MGKNKAVAGDQTRNVGTNLFEICGTNFSGNGTLPVILDQS